MGWLLHGHFHLWGVRVSQADDLISADQAIPHRLLLESTSGRDKTITKLSLSVDLSTTTPIWACCLVFNNRLGRLFSSLVWSSV